MADPTNSGLSLMQREPVVAIAGGIQILAQSVLWLVLSFGVDLSGTQTASIMFVVNALIAVIVTWRTRGRVTSRAALEALVANADNIPGAPPIPPVPPIPEPPV